MCHFITDRSIRIIVYLSLLYHTLYFTCLYSSCTWLPHTPPQKKNLCTWYEDLGVLSTHPKPLRCPSRPRAPTLSPPRLGYDLPSAAAPSSTRRICYFHHHTPGKLIEQACHKKWEKQPIGHRLSSDQTPGSPCGSSCTAQSALLSTALTAKATQEQLH